MLVLMRVVELDLLRDFRFQWRRRR
jgi:hypothetical protein